MAETSTAASDTPTLRRRLPLWARIMVWIVRVLLVVLIVKVARNPWPLLHSRVFPALVLWIIFFVYWGIAGRNSAPTKSSESKTSTWLHQIVISLALLLLFVPVPGLNGWFLPQRLQYLVALGVILQAAFMLLAIWARRHLGRNWSGTVRIGVDHELIRSGPYRVVRHPIYTAMLGMFLGTAISSSQYHALLGFGMLVLAYLRKTRLEEQILQQTFGEEYETYRRNSWSLAPLLF